MRPRVAVLLAVLAVVSGPSAAATKRAPQRAPFSVVEATIPELQAALADGRVTSREMVLQYLTRIALYEDRLNAVIDREPATRSRRPTRCDRERAQGRLRGPLHGIPIALKDNIHTTDMPTTGGALAFDGLVPPYEATLTKNLRDGGRDHHRQDRHDRARQLGGRRAAPMPANYNALAGYGLNPYDPRRDPREATFDGRPALGTGGSSSGIGTAASFWAANVGTETSGSILSPANQNMLVGIKPTVGRVSRYGVIPITADQDTPGPMARTRHRRRDPARRARGRGARSRRRGHDGAARRRRAATTRAFLDAGALKGARIGIPRAFFYDKLDAARRRRSRAAA